MKLTTSKLKIIILLLAYLVKNLLGNNVKANINKIILLLNKVWNVLKINIKISILN